MRLYNPIVNGQVIRVDGKLFDKDQTMEFGDEQSNELLKEYPFLVDIESNEFSPDNTNDARPIIVVQNGRGFVSKLKRFFK